MLVHVAGAKRSFAPGDVVEWPDDDAVRLVAKGYAAPFVADTKERAVVSPSIERRKK